MIPLAHKMLSHYAGTRRKPEIGGNLTNLKDLAGRLFKMTDTLWTNTGLRPSQYAQPVLALIALRQMEAKFEIVDAELRPELIGRLRPTPAHYQSRRAMFVPEKGTRPIDAVQT